jgi:tetratricopeptide (TPR) repeat protein
MTETGDAAPKPVPGPEGRGVSRRPGSLAADPARLFQAALMRHRAGNLAEAERNYRLSLRLDPGNAGAWINLGVVCRATGRARAAIACLTRGLRLRPDDGGAWSNLGNALRMAGRLEEALAAHDRAVNLAPRAGALWYNRGIVLKDQGALDAAASAFSKARTLGYARPDLAWDEALLTLLSGDLDQGFARYGARWALPDSPPRHTTIPVWTGEAVRDGALLIHAEQGFGDSIQFLRYVRAACETASAPIVLELQQSLHRLVQPMLTGLDVRVIGRGDPVDGATRQIALLDLPAILGTSAFLNIPPYLEAPAAPRLRRREGAFHLGLAWAGKPSHKNDRNRSLTLEELIPLLELPRIEAYGLQVGPRAADIATAGLDPLVVDLGRRVKDFADTAGLLSDLDLVITVDTSVAHLAGALGRPVWVLLPFAPDWRWQLERQDSPWYPSMTLFRQTSPGDWAELIDRVRAALAERIRATFPPA